MSVLIKDMEMPKSCYECKLDIRTDVCLAFSEWNKEHPYSIRATDRLPDCPLSEVPERKKGKWIVQDNPKMQWYGHWKCDQCGTASHDKDNFCSHCGADMRGENAGK